MRRPIPDGEIVIQEDSSRFDIERPECCTHAVACGIGAKGPVDAVDVVRVVASSAPIVGISASTGCNHVGPHVGVLQTDGRVGIGCGAWWRRTRFTAKHSLPTRRVPRSIGSEAYRQATAAGKQGRGRGAKRIVVLSDERGSNTVAIIDVKEIVVGNTKCSKHQLHTHAGCWRTKCLREILVVAIISTGATGIVEDTAAQVHRGIVHEDIGTAGSTGDRRGPSGTRRTTVRDKLKSQAARTRGDGSRRSAVSGE